MNVMLIDGNSVGYAAYNSTRLTAGAMDTQAIFGFLKTLKSLLKENSKFIPIVLWDGHPAWRYSIYPEYKGNRDKNPEMKKMREGYKKQKPYIYEVLKFLGVRQITAAEAEADDLAGVWSQKLTASGHNVLMISGDKDWVQLVGEKCSWYDPIRENRCTAKTFASFTGFPDVEQFVQAKALTGDSSDAIKGVGGIGIKGAIDFFMNYPTLEDFLAKCKAGHVDVSSLSTAVKRLVDNEPFKYRGNEYPAPLDSYRRNMDLMDLRYLPVEGVGAVNKATQTIGKFDAEKFQQLCEELHFMSIVKNMDDWAKTFNRSKKL